eukprot:g6175.t1
MSLPTPLLTQPSLTLPSSDQPMCISFSPSTSNHVLAMGTISGSLYFSPIPSSSDEQLKPISVHKSSIRSLCYASDGSKVYTGSSDNSISMTSISKSTVVSTFSAEEPVTILQFSEFSDNLLLSGLENGEMKIWDIRTPTTTMKPAFSDSTCTDYVSDMCMGKTSRELLYTSGDGTLNVFDLRKGKLLHRSEDQEDELLSCVLMKNGNKVVCGSQDGVLIIWSYGEWLDRSDGFPGHPESVDSIVKIDENTLATGSSDGIIRRVELQPNRLRGVIGAHDDFPIEELCFSADKTILASCSHDNEVRFWAVNEDEDEDSDEEEDSDDDDFDSDDSFDGKKSKSARKRRRREKKKEQRKKSKLTPQDAKKLKQGSMAGFFADL